MVCKVADIERECKDKVADIERECKDKGACPLV